VRPYQRENRTPGVSRCPDVLAKHDKITECLFQALGTVLREQRFEVDDHLLLTAVILPSGVGMSSILGQQAMVGP
jgi:hypothetical protein